MLDQLTSITQKFNQEIDRSMISTWAEKTQTEAVQKACKSENVIKNSKKPYWYCTLGQIVFETQVVRHESSAATSYPCFEKAKLRHSNSSLLLERRVVDINFQRSYTKTSKAIVEHYGFELSTSAIAKITDATCQQALQAGLPIGPGEVESGHRSVLQARLKKPGAWWSLENAENMDHLKVLQGNNHWEEFWVQKAA